MQENWVSSLTKSVAISEYLVPLQQFGGNGVIHSVFDHSFNIKVKDQLINIAHFHEYVSSFGIDLPDQLFHEISPLIQLDNRVKLSEEALMIYSVIGIKKIAFTPKVIYPLNVYSLGIKKKQLIVLKEVLDKKNLHTQIGLPLNEQAQLLFSKMCQQNKKWTQEEWQEVVNYFIGRGKGLTPSGDDILMAYQLLLSAVADPRGAELLATLGKTTLSTTDISLAYLKSAAKGYGNSLVYDLLSDIAHDQYEQLEQQVDRIMKIGHSSGKDLSFGMWLALQALEIAEK